ncbi:MAG TPA: polysaccharide biosynthesis/export family protein [Eoetvoesiella sp.]
MGKPDDVSKNLETSAPPGALTPITPELINRQQTTQSKAVAADVKDLFGSSGTYRIGGGDILNVIIWNHPELSLTGASSGAEAGSVGNGYNVSPDGLIQFPFLGPVQVGGLTEYEARQLLTNRLTTYITDPQLTVRVQSYRNGRVYIDGEVRTPGLQTMDDIPMTLPEAINRAGGFTAAADRSSIALTRKGVTTQIDLAQLIRAGVNPNSIMLEGGDLVRVTNREESKVFVLGEVLVPGSQMLRDGHLTLGEALGEARGVNPVSASPSQIYVIRKGAEGKAEIYHLDATSPTAFILADGFPLKARDLVFVDPAPVVRWNRVISMLLPSYGVINTTTRIVNP